MKKIIKSVPPLIFLPHSILYIERQMMGIELETTLLMDSPRREAILYHLADIDRIGPYEIVSKGSCTIFDRYFDTRDRAFMKKRAALRLRQIGPTLMLCMKAKDYVHEWGGIERIEIEEVWCEETLERIICALDETSLEMNNLSFGQGDPAHTLSCLGLQCIQDRQTDRITRDIIDPESTSFARCAEMALDTVHYRFEKQSFRHFEVEIEAKAAGSEQHILGVVALLKADFPGEMKRWDHNKLITGYALEALVKRGAFRCGEQDMGVIGRPGYEKIDALIRKEYSYSGN